MMADAHVRTHINLVYTFSKALDGHGKNIEIIKTVSLI